MMQLVFRDLQNCDLEWYLRETSVTVLRVQQFKVVLIHKPQVFVYKLGKTVNIFVASILISFTDTSDLI